MFGTYLNVHVLFTFLYVYVYMGGLFLPVQKPNFLYYFIFIFWKNIISQKFEKKCNKYMLFKKILKYNYFFEIPWGQVIDESSKRENKDIKQ